MLPSAIQIKGLRDIGWTDEIPEPFESFEENAAAKANLLFEQTGIPCFAEDSGLEVDALNGRPGVFSARYAGEHGNSEANINKLLSVLEGITNRSARFIAVIAFPTPSRVIFFTGIVAGTIASGPRGAGGFGYDPVFIPNGFKDTFGELSPAVKQSISHRKKALTSFIDYLSTTHH